jgi:hypothetical protein
MIFAVVGVLLAVLLLLRIIQILGGTKTKITYEWEAHREPGSPVVGASYRPLPAITASEAKRRVESMPAEWVTYAGATPPLKLLVRGQSYENYRRLTREAIDEIGQHNFSLLSQAQREGVSYGVIAKAYVVDWEGAVYPNGGVMPFSISNVTARLAGDQHLVGFVTDEAHRLSPPWPNL